MNEDRRPWETSGRRIAFENPIVRMALEEIRMPNGRVGEWSVLEIADGVAVMPIHEDGSSTLISQYRHPSRAFAFELPAGRREEGETPEITARRELREEAGLVAAHYESLGFITPLNGIARHRVHLFRATGLTATTTRHEPFEDIGLVRWSAAEIDDAIRDGRIVCGILLAALMRHRVTPIGRSIPPSE